MRGKGFTDIWLFSSINQSSPTVSYLCTAYQSAYRTYLTLPPLSAELITQGDAPPNYAFTEPKMVLKLAECLV